MRNRQLRWISGLVLLAALAAPLAACGGGGAANKNDSKTASDANEKKADDVGSIGDAAERSRNGPRRGSKALLSGNGSHARASLFAAAS